MTTISQWKLTRLENNGARLWWLQLDDVSANLTTAQLLDPLRCVQAVFKQTEHIIQPTRRRRDWYSAIDSLAARYAAKRKRPCEPVESAHGLKQFWMDNNNAKHNGFY